MFKTLFSTFIPLIVALAFLAGEQSAALAADKTGKFSGMGRYKVSGTVKVSTSGGKTTISLANNFKSSSGPDLYIYVGNGSPTKRIQKLKSFNGAQSYTFAGTSPITSVHVYCKRYSVGFGTARLK